MVKDFLVLTAFQSHKHIYGIHIWKRRSIVEYKLLSVRVWSEDYYWYDDNDVTRACMHKRCVQVEGQNLLFQTDPVCDFSVDRTCPIVPCQFAA